MGSRFALYRTKTGEDLTDKFFNTRFQDLDRRLDALERTEVVAEAEINKLAAVGLQRIDDALRPAYEELQEIANVGVLFAATTATEMTIGLGARDFIVPEDERRLFAPGHVVVVSANGTGHYMRGTLTAWDAATGAMTINVIEISGEGTFSDWLVSAVGNGGPKGDQGDPGLAGSDGSDGADGSDGVGLTPGGAVGSFLSKVSADDHDAAWVDLNGDVSADYAAGSGDAILNNSVWQALSEVTLVDAATIDWDMSSGIDFAVTLAGNRTLNNPTNVTVGKRGRLRVIQDATGSRTLSFGANFVFSGGAAADLSTAAAAEDYLYYDCVSSSRILVSALIGVA